MAGLRSILRDVCKNDIVRVDGNELYNVIVIVHDIVENLITKA